MGSDWLFFCNILSITKGIRVVSKMGSLGIDSNHELVLLNEKGEVIDRTPLRDAVVKLGSTAESVKINGKKYWFTFVPQPRGGGMASGIEYAQARDNCERRKEFKSLIDNLADTF